MATKSEVIEIKPIEIKKMTIRLVGDTPLIMHAWSEKAKRQMLEAQQGKAKGKEGSTPRQVPISITMTPDFLERLDAAAKAMSMNRSAFVKMAVSAYLKTM